MVAESEHLSEEACVSERGYERCLTVDERKSGKGTRTSKRGSGPKRYGKPREVRIGKAEEDRRSGKTRK